MKRDRREGFVKVSGVEEIKMKIKIKEGGPPGLLR